MMDLAAEARARLFQELGPAPKNTKEILGTATEHCAICPERRHDLCNLFCTDEREKLNVDGVIVTVP